MYGCMDVGLCVCSWFILFQPPQGMMEQKIKDDKLAEKAGKKQCWIRKSFVAKTFSVYQ